MSDAAGTGRPPRASHSHDAAALKPLRPGLNLEDGECRCHFAALCSLLAHRRRDGLVTGTGERLFWDALAALLKDTNERVALTAIRGLCCDLSPPSSAASPAGTSPVDHLLSEAASTHNSRAAAWLALAGEPRAMCLRLVQAAIRGSPATAATALRAAVALSRCRTSALVAGLARGDDGDGARLDGVFESAEARMEGHAAYGAPWGPWTGRIWQHDLHGDTPFLDGTTASRTFSRPEWAQPGAVVPLLRAMAQRCCLQPEAAASLLPACQRLLFALPVTTVAHPTLGGSPDGALCALWTAAATYGGTTQEPGLRRALAATLTCLRATSGAFTHDDVVASTAVERTALLFAARHVALPASLSTDAQALLHALHRSCVSAAPAVRVCAATALARVALRSPAQARQAASALLLSCAGGCVGVDDVCGTHAALLRRFAGAAAAFDQAAAASSDAVELQNAAADLHRQCVSAAAKALRLPDADTHVCFPLGPGSEPVLAAWSARTGHLLPGARSVQQKQAAAQRGQAGVAPPLPVPGLESFGSDPFGVAPPPALGAVDVPGGGAAAGQAPSVGPLFDDFSPQGSPAANSPAPRRFSMDEFDQLPSFSNRADVVADGNSTWSPGLPVAPPPPSVDVFSDPFGPGAGTAEGMRFVAPSSFAFDDMRSAPATEPAAPEAPAPAWEDPFAAPAPPVGSDDADSFFTAAPSHIPAAAAEDPFASPAAPAERAASDPFADIGVAVPALRAAEAVVDFFGGANPFAVAPSAQQLETADPFASVAAPPVAADDDPFGADPFAAAPPAPTAHEAASDPFAAAVPPPPLPADSDPFGASFSVPPPVPPKPAPAAAFSDPFADFAPAAVAPHVPPMGDPFSVDTFAAAPAEPASHATAATDNEDEESDAASAEASDEELGFDADVSAATRAVEQAIMAKFAANKAAREAAASSPGFVPPPSPPPRGSPPPAMRTALAFDDPFAAPPAAAAAAPPPPAALFPDPFAAPAAAASMEPMFAAPSVTVADPFSEPLAAAESHAPSPFDDPFAAPPPLQQPPAPVSVPAAFDDPFAEQLSAPQPHQQAHQQAAVLDAPPAVHGSHRVEPASQPDEEEEDESEAASSAASDESDEMGFDADVLAQAEAVQRSIMAKFAANKAARDAAAGSPVAAMPPPAPPQHESSPGPAVRQLAFDSDPFASGGAPAAAPQLPPQPAAPAALDVDLFSSLEVAPPAPPPPAAASSSDDWFATPAAPSAATSADPFASFAPVEQAAPPSPGSDPFGSPQDGLGSGVVAGPDPFASSAAPAAVFADPFVAQPSPPPAAPAVVAPPPSPPAVPLAAVPAAAPASATPPAAGKASSVAARAAMFGAPQQAASPAPGLRAKSPPPVVVPEPASSAASAVDSPAVQTEIKSFADRRRAFEAAAQAAATTGATQAVVRVQPSKRFGSGASAAPPAQAAPAARDSFVFGEEAPKPTPGGSPAPQARAEPPKAAAAPPGASRRAALLAEMAAASSEAQHEEASDDEGSRFPAAGSNGSQNSMPPPPMSAPASPLGPVVTFRRGLVLYDFTAEASNELSVKTGDVVMVRFDDGVKLVSDGWVSCQDQGDELGLVPDAYIAVKED